MISHRRGLGACRVDGERQQIAVVSGGAALSSASVGFDRTGIAFRLRRQACRSVSVAGGIVYLIHASGSSRSPIDVQARIISSVQSTDIVTNDR